MPGPGAVVAQNAAADAPAVAARQAPSMIFLLMQLAALVFLYQRYQSSARPPPPPVLGVDVIVPDTTSLAAAATPSPSPADEGLFGSASAMFEKIKDASSGKRRVAPELQLYETERLAALAAAGAATLQPLWRSGTSFEVFVYLSPSPQPLTAFALEVGPGGGESDGTEARLGNSTYRGAVDGASGILTGGGEGGDEAPLVHAPLLFWRQRALVYAGSGGGTSDSREQHFNVSLPSSVSGNATGFYAHVFFCAGGASPDPSSAAFTPAHVIRIVVPLVKILTKQPPRVLVNLLEGANSSSGGGGGGGVGGGSISEGGGGSGTIGGGAAALIDSVAHVDRAPGDGVTSGSDASAAALSAAPTGDASAASDTGVRRVPHWKPTLHLQLVADATSLPARGLPPNIVPVISVAPDGRGGMGYTPHVYVNEFWMLDSHLLALNASVTEVPLLVTYTSTSMWKWALQSQMQTQWELQASLGTAGEGDTDMIKSILMDTNPVLLVVTVTVSLLHTVFDFLAFRNDISFWRNAKSLEGLSARSVGLSVFFQAVILLYLIDHGSTSWMVLGSSGVGLAIEVWKLMRALGGSLLWNGWRPRVDWGDQAVSYAVSRTREYDSIATSHLLSILAPMIFGYAGYSLGYETHKSWYSWLLGSLVSFVYMFGFASMVPQLYINYRLKSVAFFPWKTMVYKCLNTVIDDLFSFVVKMPTMHRIACFRDDVIFVVYLYQRWVYRLDTTRRNEFGQSAADDAIAKALAAGGTVPPREPRRSKYDKFVL